MVYIDIISWKFSIYNWKISIAKRSIPTLLFLTYAIFMTALYAPLITSLIR
jgi:hypothetical protein